MKKPSTGLGEGSDCSTRPLHHHLQHYIQTFDRIWGRFWFFFAPAQNTRETVGCNCRLSPEIKRWVFPAMSVFIWQRRQRQSPVSSPLVAWKLGHAGLSSRQQRVWQTSEKRELLVILKKNWSETVMHNISDLKEKLEQNPSSRHFSPKQSNFRITPIGKTQQ